MRNFLKFGGGGAGQETQLFHHQVCGCSREGGQSIPEVDTLILTPLTREHLWCSSATQLYEKWQL